MRADLFHLLSQFSAIVAIAYSRCPGKGANPLVRMCLEYDRSSTNDFAPLAPCIARSADLIQPTVDRWEIRSTRQGSLTSGLPCAIDIEYLPMPSLPIPQPPCFLLLLQG